MLSSPAMTHVFVAPHPDDVALSCGGLVASLRELGQSVTILTVYSGGPGDADLSEYQREALGFGTKALWPNTQAFNRTNIAAEYPASSATGVAAPWQADPGRLRLTQERANTSPSFKTTTLMFFAPISIPAVIISAPFCALLSYLRC